MNKNANDNMATTMDNVKENNKSVLNEKTDLDKNNTINVSTNKLSVETNKNEEKDLNNNTNSNKDQTDKKNDMLVNDEKKNTECSTKESLTESSLEILNKEKVETQNDNFKKDMSETVKIEKGKDNITSLTIENEDKTEKEPMQKYESKLNPFSPEFRPQNSLYMYQKIRQHTLKNIILLIKSFGYTGIKLEKISGEYCKKYNALLNLGHAGFTNIYDLLKSLDHCLIYEELEDDQKEIDKVKETQEIGVLKNEQENDVLKNEQENDVLKSEQENDVLKSEQENGVLKNEQENGVLKNEQENGVLKNEQENETNEKATENNNMQFNITLTVQDIDNKLSITDFTNVNEDIKKEKNLLIKYKTPKMNENRQFFVKIMLGTIADITNYDSKLSEEETPITNSISLNKLQQEVKKIFGASFNLRALQIRCGINKLQNFLEEIQEIQLLPVSNEIKLRITPNTYDYKIPNLKYIKSFSFSELKFKTSSFRMNSKKFGSGTISTNNSNNLLEKNASTTFTYSVENIINDYNIKKKNTFDNMQMMKNIDYNKNLKSKQLSMYNNNTNTIGTSPVITTNNNIGTLSSFSPSFSKSYEQNLKNLLLGNNINEYSNKLDLNLLQKINNYNVGYNTNNNNTNTTVINENITGNSNNNNILPKILSKMKLHILLFQLIVILSEIEKAEWNEISRIKQQIMNQGDKSQKNSEDKESPTENAISMEKSITTKTMLVEDDKNNKDEKDITANHEIDRKKTDILDVLNNTSTTASSDYLNETYKTLDTPNFYQSEILSNDKYTKNIFFLDSNEEPIETNDQLIGVLVSSIKSEWNKIYSDQYPLSFYLNYYKTKKLRKLLEEVPNLIMSGYGRTMQIFTLDAAQKYYDSLLTNKTDNLKILTKSKFTSLSNSIFFKDVTYKDIVDAFMKEEPVDVLNILEMSKSKPFFGSGMNKNYYNKNMYNKNRSDNFGYIDDFRDNMNINQLGGRVNHMNSSNLNDDNIYRFDTFEKKNYNPMRNNDNIQMLRYHLHKLLYNLVIHICKKQNSLFLKYKDNGIILSEYEINKQLCGPVYYSSDLTYDDFITTKKTFFQKEEITKNVFLLSQYGIYGIKLIHLTNEWFKLYKCELRPLMKLCNYKQIGRMINNIPEILVVGEGFDMKYIPNTCSDIQKKNFNGLSARPLTKTQSESFLINKINSKRMPNIRETNAPKQKNVAYESIMGLLFPNMSSQKNTNLQKYNTSCTNFYREHDYKKRNSAFPDVYNSYSFKNGTNLSHLFKNL
ncbi:conserved protein, unknown function [Hepatocystis sp. ex Piliocolobus tephrosceles]|nr:conserved protein, unknown function [Hepatocystis sp. ex Piliocolobus tephrosceles]